MIRAMFSVPRHYRNYVSRGLLYFLCCCALLPVGASRAQEEAPADPLPLQRILVPASRLALELEKVRQGVLVPLPRQDFEARVQKAAQAAIAIKNRPTLVKARYVAELHGTALRGRSGVWKIHCPDDAPSVLPLTGLNLALGEVRDSTGADVLIGELDGTRLGLLARNSQEVFFDWSVRGTAKVDGLSFDLRLPPALSGTLELLLPADMALVVSGGIPVHGPRDSESKDKKTWTLQIGGKSQVELLIRHSPEGERVGNALSQVQTRIQVSPRWMTVDFDFQIDLLRASQVELVFHCDPALEPFEVTAAAADVQTWEVRQEKLPHPKTKGAELTQKRIMVRFRDPVKGIVSGLKIRCLASWSPEQTWQAPYMSLQGGSFRGESIHLTFSAEVPIREWEPGSFRVLSTQTDSDGSQTLRLATTPIQIADITRPTAMLKSGAFECHARHALHWHISPDLQEVLLDANLTVSQGRLHQLRFLLDEKGDSWSLTQLELEPKEALESFAQHGREVAVKLAHSWGPGEPLRCKLRMKRAAIATGSPSPIDFPSPRLLEATTSEGTLLVHLEETLQARVLSSSIPESAGFRPHKGEEDQDPPVFAFRFHNQKLTGNLEVIARDGEFAAIVNHVIQIKADTASVQAVVEIEPIYGQISMVEFVGSPPGVEWKTSETIGEAEARIARNPHHSAAVLAHLLGSAHWLDALAAAGRRQDETWRVVFNTPIRKKERITLVAKSIKLDDAWTLPVLTFPRAERLSGQVEVHGDFAGTELIASGLRKVSMPTWTGSAVFEIEKSPVAPILATSRNPSAATEGPRAICDRARVTTVFQPQQCALNYLRFRLRGWDKPEIPVFLPYSHELVAILVNGHVHRNPTFAVSPEGMQCDIPSFAGNDQHIEIVYRTGEPIVDRPRGMSVPLTSPTFPVEPLSLERRYRLHPLLVMWELERFERIDGEQSDFMEDKLVRFWHGADHLADEIRLLTRSTTPGELAKLVTLESGLRPRFPKQAPLRDYLTGLLLENKLGMSVISVDAQALQLAGVTVLTPLQVDGEQGRPYWETVGLTVVPCKEGLLLTTQAKALEMTRIHGAAWTDRLDESITQALRFGQDSTGSIQSLGVWLFGYAPGLFTWLPDNGAHLSGAAHPYAAWPEYKLRAGLAAQPSITLLSLPTLHWLRLVLSALSLLVLAVLWLLRRSRAFKVRISVLGWGLLAGVYCMLPPSVRHTLLWPLLIWTTALLLVYLVFLLKPTTPEKTSPTATRVIKAALGLLLILSVDWSLGNQRLVGQPAKADGYVVLLVQDREEGKQTALVAPELLKRLDAITNQAKPRTVRALLLSARYEIQCQPGQFDIKAVYELHTDVDSCTLHLPLGGVDIKEGALLDGAPTYLVPGTPVKGGYTVPIPTKGMHRLELTFTVRPTRGADYLESRFTIPRLLRSRLRLTANPEMGTPVLLASQGEELLKASAGKNTELDAHIGREGQIVLRFPLDQPSTSVSVTEVREMYFWDLRPLSLNLLGVLQYHVAKGSLGRLELDLPQGMDVRSVELVSSGAAVVSPTSLVRRWFFVGKAGRRQLHIEPASPLTGKFQLQISFVPPVQTTGTNLTLKLPVPLKVRVAESSLAYRLDGFKAREAPHNLTFTVIGEEQFALPWQAAGQKDSPTSITRALTFRRSSNDSGFNLALAIPPGRATQKMLWKAAMHGAEFEAVVEFAGTEELSLLELDLASSVRIGAIQGSPIHHWSRKGERVQVWLEQPLKMGTLQIKGWKPLDRLGSETASGLVELPTLSIKHVGSVKSELSIEAEKGVALEYQGSKGFKADVDARTRLQFETTTESGSVIVKVRKGAIEPWSRSRTRIDWLDGAWRIDVRLRADIPHAGVLQLEMADNPSGAFELSSSAGLRTMSLAKDGRVWNLEPKKGAFRPYLLDLTATVSGERNQLSMPRVRVLGSRPEIEDLHISSGLKLLSKEDLKANKKAGDVNQEVWRITPTRLKPISLEASKTTNDPSLRIPLGQRHSYPTEQGSWIHQAAYTVTAREPARLRFVLPARTRLRGVLLDGTVLAPQRELETWSLTIPRSSSWQRLELIWEEGITTDRSTMSLDSPSFPDVMQPYVIGTATVVDHWDLHVASEADPGAAALKCAETLNIEARSMASSDASLKLLLLARQNVWNAEVASATRDVDPKQLARITSLKQEIDTQLKSQQPRNGDDKKQTSDPRPESLFGDFSWQSPSVTWQEGQGRAAPSIRIPTESNQSHWQRWRDCMLILAATLGIFLLSFFQPMPATLRSTWPEQWVVIGMLGSLTWGVSVIGTALLLIGILARITWASLRFGAWLWSSRGRDIKPTTEGTT